MIPVDDIETGEWGVAYWCGSFSGIVPSTYPTYQNAYRAATLAAKEVNDAFPHAAELTFRVIPIEPVDRYRTVKRA